MSTGFVSFQDIQLNLGAVNVHLPKDRISMAHQGYGFCEFLTEEDAEGEEAEDEEADEQESISADSASVDLENEEEDAEGEEEEEEEEEEDAAMEDDSKLLSYLSASN